MRAGTIDDGFVRQTIELARRARSAGNHPFGALLVLDGAVLLTAMNTVGTDRDPTAHAETNLVAAAIRTLDRDQLGRSVLYTSCEPCAMCAGKIYWAGIRSVVYALPSEELAAMAGRDFLVPCRELFARAVDTVQVTGPRLVGEARDVHQDFWPRGPGPTLAAAVKPISDLSQLLRQMNAVLHDAVYCFVVSPESIDPMLLNPIATFVEAEGTSLIVEESIATAYRLPPLFRAAWITLRVHSDLHAVGLTAAVSGALAAEGISCNVVAAAHHDHLFVPVADGARAMRVLADLQRRG